MAREPDTQYKPLCRKSNRRTCFFVVLLIICMAIILCSSFCIWFLISRRPVYAAVYVNGDELSCEGAYISHRTFDAEEFFRHINLGLNWSFNFGFPEESVKIPLLATWEALGAEISWLNDNEAEILFEGNHCILSLNEETMYFTNSEKWPSNLNALVSKVGSTTASIDRIEKDLLVDRTIFEMIFLTQDKSLEISWDKQEKQIYIISEISKT